MFIIICQSNIEDFTLIEDFSELSFVSTLLSRITTHLLYFFTNLLSNLLSNLKVCTARRLANSSCPGEPGFSRGSTESSPPRSISEDDGSCRNSLLENGKNGEKIQRLDELKVNHEKRKQKNEKPKMKKSSKVYQALSLPTLCNMNPRSVYNKLDEFHTFVKEEQLDCIFMSESLEHDYLTLDKVTKLDDYIVISNVNQRKGKGGRPAIIANSIFFEVQDITNS